MRESWTDDRMDDLNGKVDGLGMEMRTEFKAFRREMREGFDRVDVRFERLLYKIDERFQAMDERLLATHRMMMGFCGLMFTALIGLLAAFVTQV
jgi:hypothetical protein